MVSLSRLDHKRRDVLLQLFVHPVFPLQQSDFKKSRVSTTQEKNASHLTPHADNLSPLRTQRTRRKNE
jgi:hypothetical protein